MAWACADRNCRQVGPERRGAGSSPALLMAEADQLALDAPVPPAGILAGHPQHQCLDWRRDRWSALASSRVGPAAGDELGVPAQQGSGRDQPQLAQRGGQQPAERAEDSRQVSVGRGLVRRSTATSWRSVRISASLAVLERASSASQLSTRTSIR
jgi:hypothetical protein